MSKRIQDNASGVLLRKVVSVTQVVAMLTMMVAPLAVNADQVDNRSVELGSSAAGVTTTHTFQFDLPSTEQVGSFTFEYCQDDPFPGTACTTTPTGMDLGADTLSIDTLTINGTDQSTGAAVTEDATDTTREMQVSLQSAYTPGAANQTVVVTVSGITNPSTANEQNYVRLYAWSTTTATSDTTSGSQVHDGGIAFSTAETIDVTARVQENLVFCVGTVDPGTNCASASGDAVDLGVLDPVTVQRLSDTANNTVWMGLSTNAANGVVVQYLADELKVTGATCSGSDVTDQCINESTDGTIAAGTEEFGLRATDTNPGSTDNVTVPAAYSTADEYRFAPNVTTTLASTTGSGGTAAQNVVDNEKLEVDMAATVNATTPTGLYQTTFTFIATSTF